MFFSFNSLEHLQLMVGECFAGHTLPTRVNHKLQCISNQLDYSIYQFVLEVTKRQLKMRIQKGKSLIPAKLSKIQDYRQGNSFK